MSAAAVKAASQEAASDGETLTVRHAFTAYGKGYASGERFTSSDARLVRRLVNARYLFNPLEAPDARN